MNTTWQTRIKAANRSHDVDTLEGVRAIVFEDRCVLYSVLVRARCTIEVSHAAIPGGRGGGMVVGDLSILDDHVMGKYTAHSLVESAADSILWHREIAPGL